MSFFVNCELGFWSFFTSSLQLMSMVSVGIFILLHDGVVQKM